MCLKMKKRLNKKCKERDATMNHPYINCVS